jgi:hypothetical protein
MSRTAMTESRSAPDQLDENALHYHRNPRPGKLEIQATKPLGNQRDLALPTLPVSRRPALPSLPIPLPLLTTLRGEILSG